MNNARTKYTEDDLDMILLNELELLRVGQRRLQSLYEKLPAQPQLRGRFLQGLAEVQQRAERLNAVVDPVAHFYGPHEIHATTLTPAA